MTAFVALAWLGACATSGSSMPTVTIGVGELTLQVEVAATPEDRAMGLMHRTSMPDDRGMLFVYKEEKPLSFWMKNTQLPLSIAFADRSGKIVKIKDMTPFSTAPVKSLYPAIYALEVNKGWFERNRIEAGALLTELPPPSDQ
ncbi:MAG: uncharacterized membrane protein (UPF0127 family) [Myxococcota bacterium]